MVGIRNLDVIIWAMESSALRPMCAAQLDGDIRAIPVVAQNVLCTRSEIVLRRTPCECATCSLRDSTSLQILHSALRASATYFVSIVSQNIAYFRLKAKAFGIEDATSIQVMFH
jgi:hypothetical protein